MESPEDLLQKLLSTLNKLSSPTFTGLEEIHLQKLLDHLKEKLNQGDSCVERLWLNRLSDWILQIVSTLQANTLDTLFSNFIIQLTGILSSEEEVFLKFKDSDVFNKLMLFLNVETTETIFFKHSFVLLLTNILNHNSGISWTAESKNWKLVGHFTLVERSLYLQRDAIIYVKKILCCYKTKPEICTEILQDIVAPLQTTVQFNTDLMSRTLEESRLEASVGPALRILLRILENPDTSSDLTSDLLLNTFLLKDKLIVLIRSINNEYFLDLVLQVYAAVLFTSVECNATSEKVSVDSFSCLESDISELQKEVIVRKKVCNALQLSRHIQFFWDKARNRKSFSPEIHLKFENQFVKLQLVPLCLFMSRLKNPKSCKTSLPEYAFVENENIFTLICNIVESYEDGVCEDLALKCLRTLAQYIQNDYKYSKTVFKAIVKIFLELSPCNLGTGVHTIGQNNTENIFKLIKESESLFRALLNITCLVIDKLSLVDDEISQITLLMQFICFILNSTCINTQNSVCCLKIVNLICCKVSVLTPELVQPLGTIWEKCLNSSEWEIRDSMLEILSTIIGPTTKHNPLILNLFKNTNLTSLVFEMITNDEERFVQACALKILTFIVEFDQIWSKNLHICDVVSTVLTILQNCEEAIVRREAVLFLKHIYQSNLYSDTVPEICERMAYVTLTDMDWEVKVNSLTFFSIMIDRLLSDEDVINPFSRSESSETIQTEPKDKIRVRLHKVLSKLAETGCLHLLLVTLLEDPDIQVVKKSAEIMKDLKSILLYYEMLTDDKGCVNKRKSNCYEYYHKRLAQDRTQNHSLDNENISDTIEVKSSEAVLSDISLTLKNTDESDEIISGIIDESDSSLMMNLLGNNILTEPKHLKCVKNTNPEIFLDTIKVLNIDQFVEDKLLWLSGGDDPFTSLLNDILSIDLESSVRADCY